MKLLDLFRRKRNPGRELAMLGHLQGREKIRARADLMREAMGLPPVAWPEAR